MNDTIISESLLPESYYPLLSAHAGRKWLEPFEKRPASLTQLPDEFLSSPFEMFMFNEKVYLLNWEDEHALMLDNLALTALFQTFFTFVHLAGRKINQAEHIRKLLKNF